MRKLKLLLTLCLSVVVLYSCKDEVEAPGTAYASFETGIADVGVATGATVTKTVKVYTANITGADRTIDLTIGGDTPTTAYNAPSTVTIPAGSNVGEVSIEFNETGLSIINENTFTLTMTSTADISVGGSASFKVAQVCPGAQKKIKVAVTLDPWPEEVYWRLFDGAGNIVMANNSVPAYGGYAGLTGVQEHVACLDPGTYTFQVFDQYGDGAGAINITADGAAIYANSGAYGGGTSAAITF
jgi:hypothetical protein